MAVNGWRVADSDMHVMEPADLWQRYIDPAWPHAAPIGLSEMVRDMRVRVKDHTVLRMGRVRANPGEREGVEARTRTTRSRRTRRAAGTRCRSSRRWTTRASTSRCCSRAAGLFVLGLDTVEQVGPDGLEPDYAAAIARAYNDWLRDFCSEDPTRLFGAGLLAPHDVEPRRRGGRRAASRSSGSRRCSCTRAASTGGRGTTRTTTRSGPRASATASRCASTAAARTTSTPTTRSKCSTS